MQFEQIPNIVVALLDPSVCRASDFLEIIYEDEDGDPVVGPDFMLGWFNSGITSNAVETFDPAAVRETVRILSLLMVLRDQEIAFNDRLVVADIISNYLFIPK